MQAVGDRKTRAAFVATLALGWAGMLVANLPGHLTLDSLLELYEGRTRVRQSWAPSFYAWVLGLFDRLSPGTGLYVAASSLLLFASLASMAWLRPRTSRWALLAAAAFSLSPLTAIYQAIVWKDVLFANCAVAGFLALAWAAKLRDRAPASWALLLASGLLLAAAALLRQNGVAAAVFAGLALAASMRQAAWPRRAGAAVGFIVAVIAASHAMNLATQPGGSGDGMDEGLRVLQAYDLMAAVTRAPGFPLPAIESAAPDAAKTLRRLAPRYYSAERIDPADAQPQIAAALAAIPAEALAADWRGLVLRHPALYLAERAEVFRWVLLTPRIERCLPVALGVQGPRDALDALQMRGRWSAQDDRLLAYDQAFARTAVHAHLAYAALAVVLGALLLARREPADLVMAALLAAGLAFAASFFVISIACDYRYLYFLDLAAMAALLYFALDPRLSRPGSRRAPTRSRP